MIKQILPLFFVILLLSTTCTCAPALFVESPAKTNETIIGFKEQIPEGVFKEYAVLDKNEELNCILVKTSRDEKTLESLANVKYVEKNRFVHALYMPNDSFFGEQWGLKCINVDKAWDFEKGILIHAQALADTLNMFIFMEME